MDIRGRLNLPRYIVRHPANQGHRLSALARAARFQARARIMGKPTLATLGSQRMWVYVGNAAATKVIYGEPPDWNEMQAWQRILRPGDLFVDVGANVGIYTLWAAHLGCRVIAVEPDEHSLSRLKANVELNPGADIELVEAALSDHDGEIGFSEGLDHLNRIGGGRTVRSLTLDSVLAGRHVAGVKVDVEGFEGAVLAGARETLSSGLVGAFQLEWNVLADRRPIATLLEGAGYRLMRPDAGGELRPASLDPGADIFAVR